MDRKAAYEIMEKGGYITHPILMKVNAGPLSLNGYTVYGKGNEPLEAKWKNQIHSQCFSSGWIECDENGTPLHK